MSTPKQSSVQELEQEYQNILFNIPNREQKELIITDVSTELNNRLEKSSELTIGFLEQAILKLKLVRYFQNRDNIDTNVLFDAIIESPNFIRDERGSLVRLFEIHEQKTLQKIAEVRRHKAETQGDTSVNPYEILTTTKSGVYYIARLLNMTHLIEESEYMKHCVGASDSYVNRMARGEIEILSFRRSQDNVPVITMEYDLKTRTITQLKKESDAPLLASDPFLDEFLEALGLLKETKTDTGKLRKFTIAPYELYRMNLKDYQILTSRGVINLKDYNFEKDEVFAIGKMVITEDTPASTTAKILSLKLNVNCTPEQLARTPEEITEKTTVYFGRFFLELFAKNIPTILNPEQKQIIVKNLTIGGKSGAQLEAAMMAKDIALNSYTREFLTGERFQTLAKPHEITIINISVFDLGFKYGATTNQVLEAAKIFNFQIPPIEVGFYMGLNEDHQQKTEKYTYYVPGNPGILVERHYWEGYSLTAHVADPEGHWSADSEFIFQLNVSK